VLPIGVVMVMEVGRVGALRRPVRLDVNLPENPREVVLEDLGEHLRRQALRRRVAVQTPMQAGDAVAPGRDGADVVADDHDGQIQGGVDTIQKLCEAPLARDVHAHGRLVEKQDRGLGGQGAGDHDTLNLPPAEASDRAIGIIRSVHEIKGVRDTLAPAGGQTPPRAGPPLGGHRDDLTRAERERELGADTLRNKPHQPLGAGVLGGAVEHANPTAVRREQPEGELEERGLAPAVGTENPQTLTPLDAEVDPLNRGNGRARVREGNVGVLDSGDAVMVRLTGMLSGLCAHGGAV